jgi:hypothetical protein
MVVSSIILLGRQKVSICHFSIYNSSRIPKSNSQKFTLEKIKTKAPPTTTPQTKSNLTSLKLLAEKLNQAAAAYVFSQPNL